MRNRDELRLDFHLRETLERNAFSVRRLYIKAANFFRFAAVFDSPANKHWNQPVAFAQLSHLEPRERRLRDLADVLVVQAERIRAVLINFDLDVRHAQAEVVEHVVATGRAEFGGDLVGEQAELVEVLAAEPDLNRLFHRRALLKLLHHTARAGHGAIEFLAQLHEQRFHVVRVARVDEHLREIIRGLLRLDVVIKARRGAAGEHRGAHHFVVLLNHVHDLVHRVPHAGE